MCKNSRCTCGPNCGCGDNCSCGMSSLYPSPSVGQSHTCGPKGCPTTSSYGHGASQSYGSLYQQPQYAQQSYGNIYQQPQYHSQPPYQGQPNQGVTRTSPDAPATGLCYEVDLVNGLMPMSMAPSDFQSAMRSDWAVHTGLTHSFVSHLLFAGGNFNDPEAAAVLTAYRQNRIDIATRFVNALGNDPIVSWNFTNADSMVHPLTKNLGQQRSKTSIALIHLINEHISLAGKVGVNIATSANKELDTNSQNTKDLFANGQEVVRVAMEAARMCGKRPTYTNAQGAAVWNEHLGHVAAIVSNKAKKNLSGYVGGIWHLQVSANKLGDLFASIANVNTNSVPQAHGPSPYCSGMSMMGMM